VQSINYFIKGSLGKLKRKLMSKNLMRTEKREYTLMLVPHQGNQIIRLRIPIKLLKYTVLAVCAVMVLAGGTILYYRNQASVASVEKQEIERLQKLNEDQNTQIEKLAKKTAVLQEDMNRLDKLDTDLRRLVNTEELPASRSGVVRPGYIGQGGIRVNPEISQLNELVEQLQNGVKQREDSLSSIKEMLLERNARLAVTPSIWPANGEVTSRFGSRDNPWGGGGGDWHPGIDIAGDYGAPIVATAEGKVVHSSWYGGYGNLVEIDHGNGIQTLYGHCSKTVAQVGQTVKKGEVIAYMGSTGNSTGTHVHYEIRVNGTAVNPTSFL